MKAVADKSTRDIETGGLGETADITIASSPEVIDGLINSIYSDKEKTVVRELMANAFDAMAMDGKGGEPIDVYLPTALDPVFTVRDYGIGMSHRFVMDMYSILGFSTKRDSNTATGMFGVGAKSPLAITDTFTVRAFDKPCQDHPAGRVRLYVVSMSKGIPQISHTFTSKPNILDRVELGGIEVKVPIEQSRRHKVLQGLSSQHFCWFDKNVNFSGALDETEGDFYARITRLSGNIYLGYKLSASRSATWCSVRQGAAVYPLKMDKIESKLSDEAKILLNRRMPLSTWNILIDLPIGTADVTMAREAIQYNDESIDRICRCIGDSTAALMKRLGGIVGDARSNYAALEALSKHFGAKTLHDRIAISPLLGLVRKTVTNNYKKYYADLSEIDVEVIAKDAQGFSITDDKGQYVKITKKMKPEYSPPCQEDKIASPALAGGRVLLYTGRIRRSAYSNVGKKLDVDFGASRSNLIIAQPNITIAIPSHTARWKARVTEYIRKTYDENAFSTSSCVARVHVIRCAKKAIPKVIAVMRERQLTGDIITLDKLPALPSDEVNKVSKNYSKTSVFEWKDSTSNWGKDKVEPDYAEPAYYISRAALTRDCIGSHPDQTKTVEGIHRNISVYGLMRIIKHSRASGIIDTRPIYMVTENQARKVDKRSPKWEHLPTLVAVEAKLRYESDPAHEVLSALTSIGKNLGYRREKVMAEALFDKKSSAQKSEAAVEYLKIFRTLWEDPLFKLHYAPLLAIYKKCPEFTRSDELSQLVTSLYSVYESPRRDSLKKAYGALSKDFSERYGFFESLIERASSMHDVGYYVTGMTMGNKPKVIYKESDYPELKPAVDFVQKALDARAQSEYCDLSKHIDGEQKDVA